MTKILLADDEADVRQMLSRRLQSEGYEVITAEDGVDALKKAMSEKPDVILLDIMLPKKSGNAVASELQGKPETAGIPVIYLTALVSNGEAKMMNYRSGDNQIMGKPINSADLVKLIEQVRSAP